MTLKGGASQACAVCKFQRRKCKPDCPLAPYFPADQPRMFHNAHRLFGVRNILKILEALHPSQRPIAMRTIIDEANMRDWYPVHGCLGVIHNLRTQIQMLEDELQAVYMQLEIYRHGSQVPVSSSAVAHAGDVAASQLELAMAPPNNGLCLFQGLLPQNQPQQQYGDNGGIGVGYDPSYVDGKDNGINPNAAGCWIQSQYVDGGSCGNGIQLTATVVQQLQQEEVVQDYDELHPFFDSIDDDRQSYMDSKSPGESSSESSLKDTTQSIERVGENELKSAAACFSLTSVN
ncbi:hypothetical protein MLD38_031950 [Melastoma candidum]|uniref:Uncharacterized protein n=1 Tax=Melastoma candidum TaxID=119954 RepID=A0ACB9MR97_9MYRT|nr:hypothetical protein MLD38_031950 [Melastoma candidum]